MYSNSDSVLVMNSVIALLNKDYSSSTDYYELSGDEIPKTNTSMMVVLF